jgi:hypothetical protein
MKMEGSRVVTLAEKMFQLGYHKNNEDDAAYDVMQILSKLVEGDVKKHLMSKYRTEGINMTESNRQIRQLVDNRIERLVAFMTNCIMNDDIEAETLLDTMKKRIDGDMMYSSPLAAPSASTLAPKQAAQAPAPTPPPPPAPAPLHPPPPPPPYAWSLVSKQAAQASTQAQAQIGSSTQAQPQPQTGASTQAQPQTGASTQAQPQTEAPISDPDRVIKILKDLKISSAEFAFNNQNAPSHVDFIHQILAGLQVGQVASAQIDKTEEDKKIDQLLAAFEQEIPPQPPTKLSKTSKIDKILHSDEYRLFVFAENQDSKTQQAVERVNVSILLSKRYPNIYKKISTFSDKIRNRKYQNVHLLPFAIAWINLFSEEPDLKGNSHAVSVWKEINKIKGEGSASRSAVLRKKAGTSATAGGSTGGSAGLSVRADPGVTTGGSESRPAGSIEQASTSATDGDSKSGSAGLGKRAGTSATAGGSGDSGERSLRRQRISSPQTADQGQYSSVEQVAQTAQSIATPPTGDQVSTGSQEQGSSVGLSVHSIDGVSAAQTRQSADVSPGSAVGPAASPPSVDDRVSTGSQEREGSAELVVNSIVGVSAAQTLQSADVPTGSAVGPAASPDVKVSVAHAAAPQPAASPDVQVSVARAATPPPRPAEKPSAPATTDLSVPKRSAPDMAEIRTLQLKAAHLLTELTGLESGSREYADKDVILQEIMSKIDALRNQQKRPRTE